MTCQEHPETTWICDRMYVKNSKMVHGKCFQVSDHLKSLPSQVKQDTIDVVFVGKPRGLRDLSTRQRKPGQWVGQGALY